MVYAFPPPGINGIGKQLHMGENSIVNMYEVQVVENRPACGQTVNGAINNYNGGSALPSLVSFKHCIHNYY
jgi:hypothetical protein